MSNVEYGFVIVKNTINNGRIGRYVLQNGDGTCKVLFGFEGDENEHLVVNSVDISKSHISNEFNFSDLLDRYYQIKNELTAIYKWANKDIKNRSYQHWSLTSEYNMVRMLINNYLSLSFSDSKNKSENVYVSYSYLNNDKVYQFIEELTLSGFNVAATSHEFMPSINTNFYDVTSKVKAIIFVVSKEITQTKYFMRELNELKKDDNLYNKVFFYYIDKTKTIDKNKPSYTNESLDELKIMLDSM